MAASKDNLQALFGSDSSDSEEDSRRPKAPRIASSHDEASSPDASPSRTQTDNGETRSPAEAESSANKSSDFHLLADEEDSSESVQEENEVVKDDIGETIAEEGDLEEQPVGEQIPAEGDGEDDEETRIEVDIARLTPNLEGRFIYWKMPDFIKAESKPFDPEGYDDEFEDYDEDPPPEVQDAIRQKVKGTLRWRWSTLADGSRGGPESNAKLVKWSDGSTSIVIGNEYFDASLIPFKGEYHQLFIRQGTGLQGGVIFPEKLTLRPAVANPLSRKSRMPTRVSASGRPGAKDQGPSLVFLHDVGANSKDPEKLRAELMRKEEERLKASIRRETQQRRIRERVYNRGITSGFLEGNDEEDDNTISLSAIKNSYKRGDYTRPAFSDEEESDSESRRKKLENAKDEEDDDDDFGVKKKKTEEGGAKKRVAIIQDDDEE
ncbi:RNA polymerase-associated protein LEO1-like [Paramacrobiotus metropolitanus]|uniref:RNA polymerase-associated protein LEO1-like n=1 Tax=Paramacrobiotus metropolitanus TaxID=2943436 RepID=UPI002446190E|nr:RNA polymerase-associated protein LEO1-like [Paramacrobiotus metropolitanus]